MYGCGCDRLSDSPGLRIAGDGGILQCLPGLSRRHFYCTVRDDRGRWWPFNPETSLPGEGKSVPVEPMNLYRQYFGAQRDNPFFLKAAGEYVPPLFDNPCLREVTGECSGGFPGNSSLDRACEESVGLFSGISGLGRYGAGDLG